MVQQTPLKRVLFAHYLRWVGAGVFVLSTLLGSLFFTTNNPATATAATNSTINFQARLMGASGAIVADGYYNVQFKLYDAASGGTNLWTESYTSTSGPGSSDVRIRVANGYLSTALGSITGFSGTIDWSQDLYLTMNIGGTGTGSFPGIGDGEMSPRIHLTAVPYAFRAGQATQMASGNSTLSFTNPSNSNAITLPDAGGVVCLQSSSSCNFAAASGSSSYIQNGTSLQNANFALANNGATTATTALIRQSASQTGDLLQLQNSSGGILGRFGPTGAVLFQTTTDSTVAFQVLNSGSNKILAVDTVNNFVRVVDGSINNSTLTSGTGALQIGADNTDNLALDDNEIMARSNGGTGTLYVQKLGGGLQIQATNTIVKPGSNTTTTFQVQNASSQEILTVDTSGSRATFGKSAALAGKIAFYNGTNSNTATVQSGVTSSSYTLTLPTALGASGDCLKDTTGAGVLGFGSCGGASSLQAAYDGSGTTNPQIALSATNGGIKIRDASGGVSGNMLQLQNSAGTVTFFGVATTGVTLQDTSGNTAFVFDTSSSHLRIYANTTNPTLYADIYYDDVNGEAVFAASSGVTRIGNGSGNITMQLAAAGDVFQATKTVTLASSYSNDDFTFTRNMAAGANALTGSVVKIESTSSGSGTVASNILWLNENNTSATGNLILATKGGAGNDKFKVNTGGTVTIAAGQAYTGAGAVSLTSAASTALTITGNAASTWSTSSGDLTLQAGGANKVIIKPGTDSASSFEIQDSGGTALLTSDTTNDRLQVGSSTTNSTATLLVLDSYNQSSDPTGVEGAMYFNTTTSSFRCYMNGRWRSCVAGVVFANTTVSNTINTTTTETNFNQNYSIPANDCQPGRVFRITAQGLWGDTSAAPNLTLRLKFGTTVIGATPTTAVTGVSQTNQSWRLEYQITCITAGSSGTVEGQGMVSMFSAAGATVSGRAMANTGTVTVNTTTAQTLQISAQWGTSNAANTITMRQLIVEESGP